MLTPQEVQEKKFKQAFMGGYDMAAVDEFLELVTEDFTSLFKENAVLKNKMKVLVDKIEEYRESDDSVRQAYLAVKRQAEQELEATRKEMARLMDEATGDMKARKASLVAEIDQEEKRLKLAREQTTAFIAAVRELYGKQLDRLAELPGLEITDSPRQKRDAAIKNAVTEIDESIAPEILPVEEPEEVTLDLEASTKPFVPESEPPASQQPIVITDELRQKQEQLVESFEVSFAPGTIDNGDIWEHEQDTEVPRPKFEFPDLEKQFGHDNKKPVKAKQAK